MTGVVVCVCVGEHCTGLVTDTWLGNGMLYPAYEEELEFVIAKEKGF